MGNSQVNKEICYSKPISEQQLYESPVYRSPLSTGSLVQAIDKNLNTMQDAYLRAQSRYKENNFLGTKNV